MSGSTEFGLPVTMDADADDRETALSPAEGRPLTAREQVMANIAATRESQIQRENEQHAVMHREAMDNGLAQQEDGPAPSPAPIAREQVATPTEPPAPDEIARPAVRFVNVDGHQYPVTEEQAEGLIRLGLMANTALHQFQTPPQAISAPQATPAPRQDVDDDMLENVVNQMQFGGKDDAKTALRGMVEAVARQIAAVQIDPNALIARATEAARHQAVIDAQNTVNQTIIRQEYPDIFADHQRTMLAHLNVDAIMKRDAAIGVRRAPLEIYREAGDAVYAALGRPRPGTETEPAIQAASGNVVAIRPDTVERKRAAPRATQGIDLRSTAPAAPRARTNAEYVEDLRRQRGLPSMR